MYLLCACSKHLPQLWHFSGEFSVNYSKAQNKIIIKIQEVKQNNLGICFILKTEYIHGCHIFSTGRSIIYDPRREKGVK